MEAVVQMESMEMVLALQSLEPAEKSNPAADSLGSNCCTGTCHSDASNNCKVTF